MLSNWRDEATVLAVVLEDTVFERRPVGHAATDDAMAERQLAVEAEAVAGIAAPHMGAEGATKPVRVLVDVAERIRAGRAGVEMGRWRIR